jgi:FixJ family two-component response regulator
MSVRAIKAGASEFLTKPFGDQTLVDAIQCALERSTSILKAAGDLQILTCLRGNLSR